MKIDFLKEGAEDCPMIRLYDFQKPQVESLKSTFAALAAGTVQQAKLEDVCAVETVDGTRLAFRLGGRDRGAVQEGASAFEVILTAQGWRQAAALVEPICEATSGYQWLTPDAGEIQLLLSKTGCW